MTADHSRRRGERRPARPRCRGRTARTARGQTQLDFAIGAGVFLLALAFVVTFVPTLFEPFSTTQSAAPIASDRAAATVVDLLGTSRDGSAALHAPTASGVLSPACTVAFFDGNSSLAAAADCSFDDADAPLDELLHVDGDVQVVVHGLNESAPADAETRPRLDVETRHGTVTDVETSRATADPSTATDDVTVSRRIVSVNDARYRLTVRVW